MTQSLLCLMLLNLALFGVAEAGETSMEPATTQTPPLKIAPSDKAQQHYQAAELALNQAYNQLMSSLETERQAQLTAIQQAWLTFRDAEAEFRAAVFEGGSIQPLIYRQALVELTVQRTSQLNELFQEQVGY